MDNVELRKELEARVREKYEPIREQIRAGEPSVSLIQEFDIERMIPIDVANLLPFLQELRVAIGENGPLTTDQYRRAMAIAGLRWLAETAVRIRERLGDSISDAASETLNKHFANQDQDQRDINTLMSPNCSNDELIDISRRMYQRRGKLELLNLI